MSTRKKRKLSAGQLAAVSSLFGALSESSRLELLQALHDRPLTVNELIEACDMKQSNVSKHLGILHQHRLVKRERNGNSVTYAIADPMVFALCELVCGKMARDAQQATDLFHPDI
jgi:DNA-binding transcriptional ArsR family regulator